MKPPISIRLALCVFVLFMGGVTIGAFYLPVDIEYHMAVGAALAILTVPLEGPSLLYELVWKLDRKWHRRSYKAGHVRTGWYDYTLDVVWCDFDTYLLPGDAADPDGCIKRLTSNGISELTIPSTNDTPEKRLAFFLDVHAASPNAVTPPMRPVVVVTRVGVLSGLPVREADILRNNKLPHRRVAISTLSFHVK